MSRRKSKIKISNSILINTHNRATKLQCIILAVCMGTLPSTEGQHARARATLLQTEAAHAIIAGCILDNFEMKLTEKY